MENKFINSETEEYLNSLRGSTIPDQILELATQSAEVISYLKDLETYTDARHEETAATLDGFRFYMNQELQKVESRLAKQTEALTKRVQILVFTAAVSAFAVLGMGVGLWLTK